MDTIIDIRNVTKTYRDINALSSVALRVEPGVTGLLGPNGSGKSTLIKGLLGLVQVQSGEGQILGYGWPAEVREIRDNIGYLPEDDCYIAGLVGIESVTFMARLSGLPGVEALRRAHEIMDFCDMGEERYRAVETYSTGMRQKLKFAQALVHDPKLLILDEPTTGLDPDQRYSMLQRIKNLARDHGKSIILSTHILQDVNQVCDNIVILYKGMMRTSGTLQSLTELNNPTFQVKVFGASDAFEARCQQAGFSVTTGSNNSLLIEMDGDQEIQAIWEFASQTDTAIQSCTRAKRSLEEIFVEAAGVGS